MTGIRETIEVNTKGALLGVQESGFSFLNEFSGLPKWKRIIILIVLIAIIPSYILARVGTEQYLARQYGLNALAAHAAFNVAQNPVIGDMKIIVNPNSTFSGVVLVSNPNLDLSAADIEYTATFKNSSGQIAYTTTSTMFLLADEKKYLVFPRIDAPNDSIVSGVIKLSNINWQKRLNIPDVNLKATEPVLSDESNPLTFIADGSIVNNSPYQIGTARIVFLLFDSQNNIIGVSQRDESQLLPFGRRAYKQLWPGLYRTQVAKIQVLPSTNTLDPANITVDTQTSPINNSNNSNSAF